MTSIEYKPGQKRIFNLKDLEKVREVFKDRDLMCDIPDDYIVKNKKCGYYLHLCREYKKTYIDITTLRKETIKKTFMPFNTEIEKLQKILRFVNQHCDYETLKQDYTQKCKKYNEKPDLERFEQHYKQEIPYLKDTFLTNKKVVLDKIKTVKEQKNKALKEAGFGGPYIEFTLSGTKFRIIDHPIAVRIWLYNAGFKIKK